MAHAASVAGKKTEELEEILNKPESDRTRLDRVKVYMTSWLKSHAFITVMIAASIPNPLFDLAGVTCGHFQIPFGTFFLATFIGKAINKVSI